MKPKSWLVALAPVGAAGAAVAGTPAHRVHNRTGHAPAIEYRIDRLLARMTCDASSNRSVGIRFAGAAVPQNRRGAE